MYFHPCYCYNLLTRHSQFFPDDFQGSHQLTILEENELDKTKCEVFSDEGDLLGDCPILQSKDEPGKVKCKVYSNSGKFLGDCCMVPNFLPKYPCWYRLTVDRPMVFEKGGLGGKWEDDMDSEEYEENVQFGEEEDDEDDRSDYLTPEEGVEGEERVEGGEGVEGEGVYQASVRQENRHDFLTSDNEEEEDEGHDFLTNDNEEEEGEEEEDEGHDFLTSDNEEEEGEEEEDEKEEEEVGEEEVEDMEQDIEKRYTSDSHESPKPQLSGQLGELSLDRNNGAATRKRCRQTDHPLHKRVRLSGAYQSEDKGGN